MLDNMLGVNSPSPAGTIQPDGGTGADDASSGLSSGITSLEDAKKMSEEMEDAVEKLSEVDDAYVVAVGENALVGVKLNDQYQGKADERLNKMILTRVQTVNKAVTGVAVTEDAARVKEIEALSKTLDEASSLDSTAKQAEDMMKQITVYRE